MVLLLAVTVLSGDYVLANRQVELSAAVPVEAENDMVHIGRQQVNDGDLHRFSYTTGGVEVRFLIIHKGSGVYGVGLDACDICGVTGYYQRKKDVVCLNCDVIISTPTIGFTGGCNPIPIKYKKNEQDIIIFTDELEQHVEVFKQ